MCYERRAGPWFKFKRRTAYVRHVACSKLGAVGEERDGGRCFQCVRSKHLPRGRLAAKARGESQRRDSDRQRASRKVGHIPGNPW
jgi:hypothetical protein